MARLGMIGRLGGWLILGIGPYIWPNFMYPVPTPDLRKEIDILREIDHPNIIKLLDVFEDRQYLYLVTELCTGGEMLDRILAKTRSFEGHYSERDAALLIRKILDAIDYCHRIHNICHRDLKPENCLFATKGEEAELKVIDFGLSTYDNDMDMHSSVGTPYYVAPEVLDGNYDKSCDMWSVGVIMYLLLSGRPPFDAERTQDLLCLLKKSQVPFPKDEWEEISPAAIDLIHKLLDKDPRRRPTASEALSHEWFRVLNPGSKQPRTLTEHLRNNLRRFTSMHRFKKVVLNIMAEHFNHQEIGNLRTVFEMIDRDKNGVITVDELKEAAEREGVQNLEDQVKVMMRGMDVDGNSMIDYNEFIAATIDMNVYMSEDKLRLAFEWFDHEGTGYISKDDLIPVMGSEEKAEEMVDDVDLNGDGVISYEEFKAMMEENPYRKARAHSGGRRKRSSCPPPHNSL